MQKYQNTAAIGENWVAKILRAGVYIVAFVPLVIFSQFISPFHFGKVLVFRSIIEVMAVFYFILIVRDRRWLPPRNILLIIFALFTLVFGLSSVISVNPYLSFWGSLERMGGWWSFAHYLVYFVILTGVFKTREDWLKLAKLTIFVAVLSAFYGFGQKTNIKFFIGSGNRERIFGTIGNPALFAGYQIVNLFLALAFALSSWVPSKQKGYLYFAALISTVAVLMTAVRGSILGTAVGFFLFGLLYAILMKHRMAKKFLSLLLLLFAVFILFSLTMKNTSLVRNSGYLRRMTDFSFTTRTVQTRFWAWEAGLKGWNDNAKTIIFGWGPENFNVPFSKNFNPKFFEGPGSETLFDRAHNMFIEILVTMGILGFTMYVAIFVVSYHLLWKRMKEGRLEKPIGIGLISLITAYIIHNSFIFDTSANLIVFFSVLGFIMWLVSRPSLEQSNSVGRQPAGNFHSQKPSVPDRGFKMAHQTLLIFLLIGAVYLIYKTNILQSKANYATTRALVRSWAGDPNGAVTKFKEALSYNVPGKYEYRHRYAQWVLEYTNGKKLGDAEKAALEFAIQEVQKNADENKEDYLPYLYISRLHIVLGKEDKDSPHNDLAIENTLKALEISPTFVRTYYEIAQAYLNKGDFANAIKYFEEVAKLNPEVGLSFWYLGATYFEAGNAEEGFNNIEKARELGYKLSESDLLRLISLYVKLNDFKKIVSLYEDLIKLKPNNAQHRASLAAAYAKTGEIDKAVEQARAAASIDESFEDEARAFVRSLGREL
ncbi:MAG: O-antigen ligase family protein [Candidatus Yanofskybacteria bacterium]|nr:O-antigen ligase family protein [Candidatus Yanofskybacteria bacterium]